MILTDRRHATITTAPTRQVQKVFGFNRYAIEVVNSKKFSLGGHFSTYFRPKVTDLPFFILPQSGAAQQPRRWRL